jgi:hypothetical protein
MKNLTLRTKNKITGTASIARGIDETKPLVGLNAKAGMSFSWSRGNSDYKYYNLETGVLLDVFPKDVPIFAYNNNQKVFVNLFLSFAIGSRH